MDPLGVLDVVRCRGEESGASAMGWEERVLEGASWGRVQLQAQAQVLRREALHQARPRWAV